MSYDELIRLSDAERETLIKCAIGRVFRMSARPTQPGDVEEFDRCRSLLLSLAEIENRHYELGGVDT